MKKRGQYEEEFKREVLWMAETGNKPLLELEQDLGLSDGLIRQWQRRYWFGEGRLATSNRARSRQAKLRFGD